MRLFLRAISAVKWPIDATAMNSGIRCPSRWRSPSASPSSARTEPYWCAHRDPASIPDRLAELLELWLNQPPSIADFPMVDEIFPAASHQFVLYGMGFPAPPPGAIASDLSAVTRGIGQAAQRGRTLAASLPTNRAYLDALRAAAPRMALEIP